MLSVLRFGAALLLLAPWMRLTAAPDDPGAAASTPIRHVIVVVGENHTFDNIFGGYQPRPGQTISNLLSKDIINPDGTPGANVSFALQRQADGTGQYRVKLTKTSPFSTLN